MGVSHVERDQCDEIGRVQRILNQLILPQMVHEGKNRTKIGRGKF